VRHTPGPWHSYGHNVHKDRAGDVCRPIRQLLAFAEAVDVGEEEAEANACLMAASPELLGAIQELLAVSDVDGVEVCKIKKAVRRAKAAIALATHPERRKAVRA
jgi:hypothetical protein